MGDHCGGRLHHVLLGDSHSRQQKQPQQRADGPRTGFEAAANRYAHRYQNAHFYPYAHVHADGYRYAHADAHCHENAYVNADAHPDCADTHGHHDG